MTKTFRYPISYSQKEDRDGDAYWVGEQKQLGISCQGGSFYDCKYNVEQEIEKELVCKFDTRFGAGMYSQTLAVRSEVVITVRRNATLAEFGIGVGDDEGLTDEAVRTRAREVAEHADALKEQLHGIQAHHKEFNLHMLNEVEF